MPKGVICGGAVDGSNQLGEIVTCHAITARPDGSAAAGRAAKAAQAINIAASGRRQRRPGNAIIGTLPPTAQPPSAYLLSETPRPIVGHRNVRGQPGWPTC